MTPNQPVELTALSSPIFQLAYQLAAVAHWRRSMRKGTKYMDVCPAGPRLTPFPEIKCDFPNG